MNTRTKSTLLALVSAITGVLIVAYVPEGSREQTLGAVALALGALAGWLGIKKPGQ